MACLVGYRHLLTRVPSGEGGVSIPKWGGGGRLFELNLLGFSAYI